VVKTGLFRMTVTRTAAVGMAMGVAIVLALITFTMSAQAATQGTRTFNNNSIIMIPADRISGGTGGEASPYPSGIRVTGFKKVTDVNVILRSAGHTDPDDLDVLLVGPTGRKAILWSDAGGSNDIIGINVKLDDEAPVFLPDSGQITQGSYRTSNYEFGVDTWPGVTETGNRLLSTFDGTDPTGAWRLYVFDDVAQPDTGDRNGTGTFANGWSLQVKGVCKSATANNRCQ
jgi:subtilisin-like proprotein convertase family protein